MEKLPVVEFLNLLFYIKTAGQIEGGFQLIH